MDVKSQLATDLLSMWGTSSTLNLETAKDQIETILCRYSIAHEREVKRCNLKRRINHFLTAKKIDGLSDRTIQNYRIFLNSFAEQVGKHVAQINTDDIREYLSYLSEERRLKPGSLQTHINTLRTFFSWLSMEGIVKRNPMLKIKSLKIDRKNARESLTPEELERLRDACHTYREKALIEFLVSSGCRLSEATNITVHDIDFINRSIKVLGKGNKYRTVYFSVRAKFMIEEYCKQRKGGSALFASTKAPYAPLQTRAIQQIIRKLGNRAALTIRIYPHLLRHTFATHAINAGMKLTVLQTLMGHEDSNTTLIYASLSQETVRHEYDQFVAS